jgi:nucleotide-binding universal stress UspA family protein
MRENASGVKGGSMSPRKRLNILLADDGSQHAQAAVKLLQHIPLSPTSQVRVVRAFSSGQIEAVPEIEASLKQTETRLSALGLRVEVELKLAAPADLILGVAEANPMDLIILGAKGLRSTAGILLGGVAQQVVEYSTCPVLIVRAPFQGLRKVLLVTDGSPSSLNAALYMADFPWPDQLELHVLHVLPPLQVPVLMEPHLGTWQPVYSIYPSRDEEALIRERDKEHGEALLKRTSSLLHIPNLVPVPVLVRGDAATEIMEYAASNHIDLIVAGSRGLSNFKSILVGSVSRKLVHYSNCSVLIVKEPKKE